MGIRQTLSDIKYVVLKASQVRHDRTEDSDPLSLFSPADPGLSAWTEGVRIIRHAGGETPDHERYTNSLEAFEYSASLGCRAIETDLDVDHDGRVLLIHREGNKGPGENTLMDLHDLLGFMDRHPDIYIVTDCKNGTLMKICASLIRLEERYRKRFVIQLYSYEDRVLVESIGSFDNYIFTLYDSGLYIWNSERIVKHCLRNRIGVVTMPSGFVRMNELKIYADYGIRVFIHSAVGDETNDPVACAGFMKRGVYGFYSDVLTESDLS